MKLAEALSNRQDLVKEIENLSNRLNLNSKVQEGENPTEDVNVLLDNLDLKINELEDIIKKINRTNHEKTFEGIFIADMVAKRDALVKKIRILQQFADSASQKIDRYSKNEIKIVSTIDVTKIRKKIDLLSKELRLTENKIQQANWTIDLID